MNMNFKNVSVVGLGYIGLPTAAILASRKIHVIGVDVNEHVINVISNGKIHIVEPELDIVVHAAVTSGYLRATLSPEPSDAFIIAVPTPFKNGHEPDLTFIESSCKSIAPVLEIGNLVLLESSSPVGTTEQMAAWLSGARPDLTFPQTHGNESDIHIAHCPERVMPGHVIRELVENDRVIGGMTEKSSLLALDLYKIFVKGDCSVTDVKTAEMCKLVENSFRDTNIAFANELSIICDKLNIDVWELIRLANKHPRVNILQPGPGVGGHCIAVDPWFIVTQVPDEAKLIRTARMVNQHKPEWILNKIRKTITELTKSNGIKEGEITIACYGITFKPDIDDIRESPALDILRKLSCDHQGKILVIDPCLDNIIIEFDSNVEVAVYDVAVERADIHVLLVDHTIFIGKKPEKGMIIDSRGIW